MSLPILLGLGSCATSGLWRDQRTKATEILFELEGAPLVVLDDAGNASGLVCKLRAEDAQALRRWLPDLPEAPSWLLLEPLQHRESFFGLSFDRHEHAASLDIVDFEDGSPRRIEVVISSVRWGFPGVAYLSRGWPTSTRLGLVVSCRISTIEEIPRAPLTCSLKPLYVLRRCVQDNDASTGEKLVITPFTLALDLACLPLQPFLIGFWL